MSGPTSLIPLVLIALAGAPAASHPPAEAERVTAPDEELLPALAVALTRGMTSERDKAESIYRWIAHNVAYDVAGLVARRATAATVSEILVQGVALCDGYSELFRRLAELAGLEAYTIIGYAKAYGYVPGAEFRAPNHAWNAVKIDGEWHLLDVTWGAGRIDQLRFIRGYDDFWFLTPAEEFAFSHLPAEERWQLLDEPLSLDEFEAQPAITPAQFVAGFAPLYLRALMADPTFRAIPDVFMYGRRRIRIHNVPLRKELRAGQSRDFRLEVDGATEVVVVNDGVWYRLQELDGVFSGEVLLRPGQLTVNARYPERGDVYWPVMVYAVAGGRDEARPAAP